MKTKRLMLTALVAVVSWLVAAGELPAARRVMNIVNFVRGCEPRVPDRDLVEPLRREIELNSKYKFPNTILLQYDAMLRSDLLAVARSAEPGLTEYGVWVEIVKPLVEKIGLKWRRRLAGRRDARHDGAAVQARPSRQLRADASGLGGLDRCRTQERLV